MSGRLGDRRGGRQKAVLAVLALGLGALSACARSTDDRLVHFRLTSQDVTIPRNTQIAVKFDGYQQTEIMLGGATLNAQGTVADISFLLPGFGNGTISVTFTINQPELEAVLDQVPQTPQPIIVVLTIPKKRPDGGAGGMGGGDGGRTGTGGSTGTGGRTGFGGATGSGGATGFGGTTASGGSGAGGIADGGTGGMGGEAGQIVGPPDGGTGGMGGVGCDAGTGATGGTGGTTAPIPTCSDYCTTFTSICGSPYADNCTNICLGLHWDQIPIPANPIGNNLQCRIDAAKLADPEDLAPMCSNASATPMDFGGCGTPCDVFCDGGKTNCPNDLLFANPTMCRTACHALSATNRKCRVDALVRAGLLMGSEAECNTASQGTGCQ